MSMKDVGRNFRIGSSTVSGIIPDVCTAIWDVLGPIELPTPDKKHWLEISEEFNERWNFPRCLGKCGDETRPLLCMKKILWTFITIA